MVYILNADMHFMTSRMVPTELNYAVCQIINLRERERERENMEHTKRETKRSLNVRNINVPIKYNM